MGSKTVKFNLFSLLAFVVMATGAYLGFFEAGTTAYVALIVVNIVVSQAITFFSPSGEFVGAGQNWSFGKWVARLGAVLLATFMGLSGNGIATAVIAALTPIVEIFIRIYGSETDDQIAAAARKRA